MTDPKHTRTPFLIVIGVAMLLAMVPVALVVWIQGDGADGGALDALVAATPILPGARNTVVTAPAAARPMQPLPDAATAASGAPEGDVSDGEADFFTGVPRAWTAPYILHGRVVDERGAPLAGARITYLPDDATRDLVRQATGINSAQGALDALLPSAVTHADGVFLLVTRRGVPGAGTLGIDTLASEPAIVVDDPRGMALVHPCRETSAGRAEVGTLVLRSGAVVRGRVTDPEGRSLAARRVVFEPDADTDAAPELDGVYAFMLPAAFTQTETDAAGRYEFAGAWPGKGRVLVDEPGWRRAFVTLESWSVGAVVEVPDLVTDTGLNLAGVVHDELGNPMAGATVFVVSSGRVNLKDRHAEISAWLSRVRDGSRGALLTSATGEFRAEGLSDGPQVVLACAPGFALGVSRDVLPGAAAVTLHLAREPRLVLRLVDGSGAPVRDAAVHAAREHNLEVPHRLTFELPVEPAPRVQQEPGAESATLAASSAARGADGRWAIHSLGADRVVALIRAPGFASVRLVLATDEQAGWQGASDRIVTLAPEARVAGRVVDDAGAPVPHAWVRLLPNGRGANFDPIAQAVADEDGRFDVGGLAAGDWVIDAAGEDVRGERTQLLKLDAGQHLPDVSLVLRRAGAIAGRARLADGRNLEHRRYDRGPREEVLLEGPSEARVWQDRSGRFGATGLLPGTYRVTGPRGTTASVDVHAGEIASVELQCPAWAVVAGRVLADGVPVAGAEIHHESVKWREFVKAGGSSHDPDMLEFTLSDERGEFLHAIDGSGEYRVWAELLGGGGSASVTVSLEPGAVVRADLLALAGRIEGEIVDAVTGAPIAGAVINGVGGKGPVSDDLGRFVIRHLHAGKHGVSVRKPGYLEAGSGLLELGADGVLTGLRLALVRSATLEITVLAPDGRPLNRPVRVAVWRDDFQLMHDHRVWQLAMTKLGRLTSADVAEGSYHAGLLPEGLDEMAVQARDLAGLVTDQATADLVAGETRSVVLHAPGP